MKHLTYLLIVLSSLILHGCDVSEKKSLKIEDFKFKSIFGTTAKEPKNIYCLLGTGYFRAPSSSNSDSLIDSWIRTHPDAIVVPVSSLGHVEIKDPETKMTYCWVIDNKDTLNNYLVKKGCFPGGTMMRPKTWDEMEKQEKEIYQDTDEKPDVKVHIKKKAYDNFLKQIERAELFAQENRLGIWLKKTDE